MRAPQLAMARTSFVGEERSFPWRTVEARQGNDDCACARLAHRNTTSRKPPEIVRQVIE
jgi:hypothetical protein